MTLSAANPGGWALNEVLTSTQMNHLQSELLKALDGVNGGIYALASALTFNAGADVRFGNIARWLTGSSAQFVTGSTLNLQNGSQQTVFGTLRIESLANLDVKSGGFLDIESAGRLRIEGIGEILDGGDFIVRDNGNILVEDGGVIDLASGALIDVGAGGLVTFGGVGSQLSLLANAKIVGSSGAEIKANDSDDFTINNCSYAFEVALNPIRVGGQWLAEDGGTFICATVATSNRLVFPVEVPAGDVITSMRMTINGGAGGGHGGSAPADRPILEFGKVSINGVYTSLQTLADPTNTGGAYDIPHTVNMSGGVFPYTMTNERHLVRVVGEGITGGVTNTTRLCSIDGLALAKTVRQLYEVR